MIQELQQILAMNEGERHTYVGQHEVPLLQRMLQHIGDPNSKLRDQLNYRVFIELLASNTFSQEGLKTVSEALISDDLLFLNISGGQTDSVFTRTFTTLWLTGILHVDARLRFIEEDKLTEIFTRSSRYFLQENDVRGFVDEARGWAHSMAHGADLMEAIIRHPKFDFRFAPFILQGLKEAFWKGSVYIDDEEERFAKIIDALISVEFNEEVLIEWVEQTFDKLEAYLYQEGYTPAWFKARTNTLHFMKTLYFTVKFRNKYDKLRGVTSIFIQKWMKM
ncbi:DUF2785 domain-containing protein [Lysinibacillus sp. 54212]|uniref:DUF2785 domain-containing protein n=1 Tax=Lysinibacillus sp. 54212 TaxID=3119829 RepID=UPI002FC98B4F